MFIDETLKVASRCGETPELLVYCIAVFLTGADKGAGPKTWSDKLKAIKGKFCPGLFLPDPEKRNVFSQIVLNPWEFGNQSSFASHQ